MFQLFKVTMSEKRLNLTYQNVYPKLNDYIFVWIARICYDKILHSVKIHFTNFWWQFWWVLWTNGCNMCEHDMFCSFEYKQGPSVPSGCIMCSCCLVKIWMLEEGKFISHCQVYTPKQKPDTLAGYCAAGEWKQECTVTCLDNLRDPSLKPQMWMLVSVLTTKPKYNYAGLRQDDSSEVERGHKKWKKN